MEKPRKREIKSNDIPEQFYCCGWNDCHDAMSTWLEREVPTEYELEITIRRESERGYINAGNAAKAIHELLTRKLTGKDKANLPT